MNTGKASLFWPKKAGNGQNREKAGRDRKSAEKRAAEERAEDTFEMFSGGGVLLLDVVARDSCEAAGEKVSGIVAVLPGTLRQVEAAFKKRIIEAVLKKVENVVADEKGQNFPAVRDIDTVGVADVLQRHGGAAALVFLGPEAVLTLELEGNDIVLGFKKSVEGLAGNAGALADLADADAGIRLHDHKGQKRVCDGGL